MRPRRTPGLIDPGPLPTSAGARFGAVMGASAAALISAGLVYWIGVSEDPTLKRFSHPQEQVYASSETDAGQVVRAYDQLKEIYAGEGAPAVAEFARGCARSLSSDPRQLDFCVAFDIYAASVMGDDAIARAWRSGADERELALVRVALAPTEDPLQRLARIRELARRTSLQASELAPRAPKPAVHRASARHVRRLAEAAPRQPVAQAAAPAAAPPGLEPAAQPADMPAAPAAAQSAAMTVGQAKPRARPAAVKRVAVKGARPPAGAGACRKRATAGERTVCASPALRQADAQLQSAYRKAVAAGANPQELARDQASFRRAVNAAAPDRVAVERLYYQRTRALEGLSESP